MTRTTRRWGIGSSILALTTASVLAVGGVAYADNIQDTITDTVTGLTLVAGSGSASAAIRLIGNNAQQDPDNGCNIDAGEAPLVLDIHTPTGVTATPNQLSITACNTDFAVTFTASGTAVGGHVTATINSAPAGGGSYNNQVDIPITITHPNTAPSVTVTGVADGDTYPDNAVPAAGCSVTDAEEVNPTATPVITNLPADGIGSHTVTCDYTDAGGLGAVTASATYNVIASNTKPTVAVTGVLDGESYEIGSVPTPGCAVTDAEDVNPTATPVVTGALSHGLGSQTVTCDYTDGGDLVADTATATYTIVDTADPTIEAVLVPATPNGSNGWYNTDVEVSFLCEDDPGSGIQACVGDTVLGEGSNQSVTGTATDWADNTAELTVSGINVDKAAPIDVEVSGVSDYFYGTTPGTASCTADGGTSGLDSCTVTGFGQTAVGSHNATVTATDIAGNVETFSVPYVVKAWTRTGFYAPVDMGGVLNVVKGGSTVPLKFEVFGDAEFTSTSVVKSFVQRQVTCGSTSGTDDVEFTTTGKTELRYDAVAGQFIQNWQTPKGPAGTCYVVTMTLQDGVTTLVANFKLK